MDSSRSNPIEDFDRMVSPSMEAMSAVCAWDEAASKLLTDPYLRAELRLSEAQLHQASKILRSVQDATLTRRCALREALGAAFQVPENELDNLSRQVEARASQTFEQRPAKNDRPDSPDLAQEGDKKDEGSEKSTSMADRLTCVRLTVAPSMIIGRGCNEYQCPAVGTPALLRQCGAHTTGSF